MKHKIWAFVFVSCTLLFVTIANADSRLINISTNGHVGAFGLRAGFIVSGSNASAKRLVVLGERFDSEIDPVLKVTDLAGTTIYQQNDNWRDAASATEVEATLNRPPGHDLDAAFALTLMPGVYVAVLESKNGKAGNGIVAINDLSDDGSLTQLINLSTNGHVSAFGLRAGFIIDGDQPKRIIALAERFKSTIDPLLKITDLTGSVIYHANDNWQDDATAAEVVATLNRSPGHDSDAAFALTLEPNVYIAWLESGNGEAGNGIVAINDLPSPSTAIDIRGSYTGSGSVTWRDCIDPAFDNTYPFSATLEISSQSGSQFSGTARTQNTGLGIPAGSFISLTGSINADGRLSGTLEEDFFLGGVLDSRGTGSFTGQTMGSAVSLQFSIQDIEGDTCFSTGSITVTK